MGVILMSSCEFDAANYSSTVKNVARASVA